MKKISASVLIILATAVFPAVAHATPSTASPSPADRQGLARVGESFGKLPLYFVENRGQLDPRVAYYVQGGDKAIYFTDQGLTFALNGPANAQAPQRWALKLDFVGSRAGARSEGLEPTAATFSYFSGSRSRWRTGLKSYSQVIYRDLWPGIDVVYTGTADRMKYTFVVQPGADPEQIRLAWRGASGVELNAAGELAVTTPAGGFTDERPVSWQEADGRRVAVETRYELAAADSLQQGKAAVGYSFAVGDYDRSRELVIDPAVLVYAGFLGTSAVDSGNGIAVDGAGNAYVTGSVFSSGTGFPVTVGPDLTQHGSFDTFVAKIDASGAALVYAGFIGGSGNDQSKGIAVDGAGNAYVTGTTTSDEGSFPVTVGPDLTFNSDYSFLPDAFVAKVNAAGTALDYCGYIGGGSGDVGNAIAVDGAGNAYIGGSTSTSEATFPVTVGPDLTYNGGFADGFVAKVDASGTGLAYCGYIGGAGLSFGSNGDHVTGIAVDGAGNAYVAGRADSDETTFPVVAGPDLTYNGDYDAFVAKVDPSGAALLYSGFIGGASHDEATSIAVDSAGNAYVAGFTNSDESSFPTTVGPHLVLNGFADAFVAKVDASGTALLYSGYIGGDSFESASGIAVDGAGSAYIAGITTSDESSFPVTGGPGLTYAGGEDGDAFVARIKADGTALVYAGYIGGSGDDNGAGIAVDGAGNAYVIGSTSSDETSFPVAGGPVLTYAGGSQDAFVAKISYTPPNAPAEARCRNLTVSAGPSCTAGASVDNGSFDSDGGDTITLVQSPAGPYALGATAVTLTVTDNHGAASSCMGTVTVADTTAPAITCPVPITANGSSVSGGAVVFFAVSATDACDSSVGIVETPASGSSFPFGTTTFFGTATDDAGNSAQCSSTITVRTPREQVAALSQQINALVTSGALAQNKANPLINKLNQVIAKIDNGKLTPACNQLGAFINQVNAYVNGGTLTTAQGQALIAAAQAIEVNLGC